MKRALVFVLVALALLTVPVTASAAGPFVSPASGDYGTRNFCLFASGFQPNETVTQWLQTSDLSLWTVFSTRADSAGKIGADGSDCITPSRYFPAGKIQWVAHGSKYEASAWFTYNDGFATASKAGLFELNVPRLPTRTPIFTFAGFGFAPGEKVNLWASDPISALYEGGYVYADSAGAITFTLTPGYYWMTGDYLAVAHGATSGREYTAKFKFWGYAWNAPSGAGVKANPSAGPYGTEFSVVAGGFKPGEAVNYWFEFPDYSVAGSNAPRYADDLGRVYVTWVSFPGELVGMYRVVFQGKTSNLQEYGTFMVVDTPLNP